MAGTARDEEKAASISRGSSPEPEQIQSFKFVPRCTVTTAPFPSQQARHCRYSILAAILVGTPHRKKTVEGPLDVFVQSLILLPGNISSSPCIPWCCYCHNSYGAEGVSLHTDVRGEARSLAVVWKLVGNVGNISCSPGIESYFVLHRCRLGSTSLNQE